MEHVEGFSQTCLGYFPPFFGLVYAFATSDIRNLKAEGRTESEIVAYFDENYMDSTETPGVRFALRRQGYQI